MLPGTSKLVIFLRKCDWSFVLIHHLVQNKQLPRHLAKHLPNFIQIHADLRRLGTFHVYLIFP